MPLAVVINDPASVENWALAEADMRRSRMAIMYHDNAHILSPARNPGNFALADFPGRLGAARHHEDDDGPPEIA